MKTKQIFTAGLVTGMLLCMVFTSCTTSPPPKKIDIAKYWSAYVVFPNATVNGQPVHLILDTGFGASRLTNEGAIPVGLKPAYPPAETELQEMKGGAWLPQPAQMKIGTQTFTVQIPVQSLRFTPDTGFGCDGIIDWPEIRDNDILFFDSANRTVRSLEKLPEETANWLKLKIHPYGDLALDIPLADGKTGTMIVDTGGTAVALLPAQFKEWRDAHPHALTDVKKYYEPGAGRVTSEQPWADEIQLGPITLTDVPLRLANDYELTLVEHFCGMIGLYVLERMDLIVDNKNGYAYLRTKPPPGPPFGGYQRPSDDHYPIPKGTWDWTMAENVKVSIIDIVSEAGELKIIVHDYAGAVADYTRALNISHNEDDRVWYYRMRGEAKQLLGDLTAALADYDQAIALSEPNSHTAQLYRQVVLRQLGRPTGDFAKTVAGWDDGWGKTRGQFLAGQLSETDFLAAAKGDGKNTSGQQCQAFYYIGMMRLANGDIAGARGFLQKSAAIEIADIAQTGFDEHELAQAELARLDGATQH
jgi:tetratricopeptide (TPR) repeat protein